MTPTSDESISLNYSVCNTDNYLRVEIYTDPETRIKDETDIYKIVEVTQTSLQITIVLSLINQIGYPPPYLRYTLQQMKSNIR
ncbi:MAG: hypothetical protein SNH27_01175 [Rikenellaceae bacterium]